jgi:hypothetical protein
MALFTGNIILPRDGPEFSQIRRTVNQYPLTMAPIVTINPQVCQ